MNENVYQQSREHQFRKGFSIKRHHCPKMMMMTTTLLKPAPSQSFAGLAPVTQSINY
jgi:hypothetical protein